jgi:hypothetical protein
MSFCHRRLLQALHGISFLNFKLISCNSCNKNIVSNSNYTRILENYNIFNE